MLNDGRRNRAEVPAVEAPAIKVGDDPETSGRDDVLAVGPWVEGSSTMVLEMGGAVRDELAIDSDAIRCDLHLVARDSGDWLHQR